jgi:hypothetical protein
MPNVLLRLSRHLVAALLLGLALTRPAAAATDFTDIWWNPAESGWGVNFIQSDQFIFATFFIYGTNKQPYWVTAQLLKQGNQFTGPVYLTTGTYYGTAWVPADVTAAQVGTATFTPSTSADGSLVYSINGVTVTKAITRQTLTPVPLAGKYYGGLIATLAGCPDPATNGTVNASATITVSQVPNTSLSFVFDVQYGSFAVQTTLSGAAIQQGLEYRMPAATLTAPPPGGSLTVHASEIKRTTFGIEGRWEGVTAQGCTQTSTFSAAYTGP